MTRTSSWILLLGLAVASRAQELGPPVAPATAYTLVRARLQGPNGNGAEVLIDPSGRAAVIRLEQGAVRTLPTLQLSASELARLEAAVRTAELGQPGADLPPFAPHAAELTLSVSSTDPALQGSRTGYDPLPIADPAAEARLRGLITSLVAAISLADQRRAEFDWVTLECRGPGTSPTRLRVSVGGDGRLSVDEENYAASPPLAHSAGRSITVDEQRRLLAALRAAGLHALPSPLPGAGANASPVRLEVHGTQSAASWSVRVGGEYPTAHAGGQALLELLLELARPLRLPASTSGLVGALAP